MFRFKKPILTGMILSIPASLYAAPAGTAQTPTAASNLLQMVFGLLAVIAVMAVFTWILKRIKAANFKHHGALKIINGVNVGNRERIVLIEVDQQWIVVGVTPQSITSLLNLPRPATTAEMDFQKDEPLTGQSFSTWLQRTLTKRNESRNDPIQ